MYFKNKTRDMTLNIVVPGLAAVVVSATGLVTVAEIAGSKTNKEPKLKQGRITLHYGFYFLLLRKS